MNVLLAGLLVAGAGLCVAIKFSQPRTLQQWYYEEASQYAKAELYGGTGVVESYRQGRNEALDLGQGIWKAHGYTRTVARGSQAVMDPWVVYLDTKSGAFIYASGNYHTIGDQNRVPALGRE